MEALVMVKKLDTITQFLQAGCCFLHPINSVKAVKGTSRLFNNGKILINTWDWECVCG